MPIAARFVFAALCVALLAIPVRAENPAPRTGEVHFTPVPDEEHVVPEPFQLAAQTFSFEQTAQPQWSGDVAVSTVTFPSPVHTPEPNNNTVHCEYFRPAKPGKYPACVVLHILGGDFPLARLFANNLAQHGVAALFVHMPYYGERRQPDSKARMISTDPTETVRGMIQAGKDIRYAPAWPPARRMEASCACTTAGPSSPLRIFAPPLMPSERRFRGFGNEDSSLKPSANCYV